MFGQGLAMLGNMQFIIGFCIIIAIISIIAILVYYANLNDKLSDLANKEVEVTPEEFFKLRNASIGGRGRKHISTNYEFSGVYVLLNKTKNLYYVGQGVKVFKRVNDHFTGHGNGDVYADYKYGDNFTIKMIKLEGSGFNSLNELEREMIRYYNAFSKGYNKTRGNKG